MISCLDVYPEENGGTGKKRWGGVTGIYENIWTGTTAY